MQQYCDILRETHKEGSSFVSRDLSEQSRHKHTHDLGPVEAMDGLQHEDPVEGTPTSFLSLSCSWKKLFKKKKVILKNYSILQLKKS